jgi:autotransporter-associated beta strand protein
MKHNLLATSLLCLALGNASVHATLLYWSANGTALGGSTGTWDTTNQRWGTSTSGPFTTVWNNANTDSATLSASGAAFGTVVLGANVTMNGTLSIEQTPGTWPAWTINGANTITFGASSTLAGPATGSSTINGKYAGTITKTGAGTIIFNNSGGSVTKFILKQGISTFSAGNRFGSGADRSDFLTFDGGQTRADVSAWGSFGKSISLTANGGTINGSASSITMTADKPISSTGNGRLTINLAQLTLSNTGNNWTGPMTINASGSKVTLGAAGVIPDTCVVTANGTLALANFSETIGSLAGSGSVTLGSGTLTIGSPAGETASAVISGTGGIVKNGTGTWIISGANTYTGTTTVGAGTLKLGTATTIPASSPVIIAGGSLDVNSLSPTITSLSGGGSIINNSGTLTVNGNLTTASSFTTYSCFSGVIAAGTLAKSGTHAMALRGANTFSTLTLNNGTLSVGVAPDRLPATLDLSVASGALFQLDANDQTVASLAGAGSINLGGGTLTVNEAGSHTFLGVIQNSELAGSSTAAGNGLRGYYYDNEDFTNLKAVRDDATVNFADLTVTNATMALPDAGIANSTLSIRWLGKVLTTTAGTYNFTTTADDGTRLWVNGTKVVDNWVSQGAIPKSGTIDLAAATQYDIVMEYFDGTGGASAVLSWMPPGDSTTNVIPNANLILPGPGALIKIGAGTTTLSGASTYTGPTTVSAGTLDIASTGKLGATKVTVADLASLTLESSAAIDHSASLLVSPGAPVVNLNFNGTNKLTALSFDGGSTFAALGVWGPVGSAAPNTDSHLNGTGYLAVVLGSATAVTSSINPTTYGDSVTFTATVTGSGVTPTGTVTFKDGATVLATATLDGSGQATFTTSAGTAGAHPISAEYAGDDYYYTSTANLTQTVNKIILTPVVTASGKTYDATTAATIASRSLTGVIIGADDVSLGTSGTAKFVDKTVATGKTVNVTGLALSGTAAGNYQLSSTSAAATADISAATLTVSGITANSKPFDGNTVATLNTAAAALVGVFSGDTVILGTAGATGAFADPDVADGKTVTINGLSISGGDAPNYSLVQPTAMADIKLPLTVTGIEALDKVYDVTTNATLVVSNAVLNGVQAPDEVFLSTNNAVGYFDNKNVGTGKTVTITGLELSGAAAAKYLIAPTTTNASIMVLPITVMAQTATKVYDGTTNSAVVPAISPAVPTGDTANFSQTYDTKDVGTGKTLTPAGSVTDGNGGANYAVTFANNTTGEITPKLITVTAVGDSKVYDSTTGSARVPTVSPGVAAGDTANFSQAYDTKHAGSGKTLTPDGAVTDGNGGANYAVTLVNDTAGEITTKPITVTAVTNTKPYDGNTSAAGVPTVSPGVAAGDTANFLET